MRKILKLMLDYSDKAIQIPIFVFILMVIIYLIYIFIKKEGIYKFIPSLIILALGIYFFFSGLSNMLTPRGLQNLQLGIISIVTSLIGLLFAWILNIRNQHE